MAGLRVLLADDHRLMLAAARRVLERHDDFEIVGEVMRGTQVVAGCRITRSRRGPARRTDARAGRDRVPEASACAWIERAGGHHLELRRRRARRGCSERGRSRLCREDGGPCQAARDRARCRRGRAVQRQPARRRPRRQQRASEREVTVLAALTRGLSNRQIGEELWVSEQTVKFHLRNVYRKIDVKKRAEAVRWAYSHGVGRELSRVAQ